MVRYVRIVLTVRADFVYLVAKVALHAGADLRGRYVGLVGQVPPLRQVFKYEGNQVAE